MVAVATEVPVMSSTLRAYTLEEVARHNTAESLWLVIEDKVYDVTEFVDEVLILDNFW